MSDFETPIKSSQIEHVKWFDPEFDPFAIDATGTLLVTFKGGSKYEYIDVPESVARALVAAESPGKFLNSEIKGKYAYKKVTP